MLRSGSQELSLDAPLAAFARDGFARLGPVLSEEGARQLASRAKALMLGEHPIPELFYQHDSPSGRYEDLVFGAGWVGPSLAYRKLEGLERDPLFEEWVANPLFGRIARSVLGAPVKLYRAVLWNKASRAGMDLPWHQDDGEFWGLDRPPCLQLWTALDDASPEAGCVEVVPGSHLGGLATHVGGTVPRHRIEEERVESRSVLLPAKAGEVLLIHNHLWHRSGRNATDTPRRAIGISYLSGDTRCKRKRREPRQFRTIFQRDGSTDSPSLLAGGSPTLRA